MTLSLYTSEPFTYPGGGIAAGVMVRVVFTNAFVMAPLFLDDLGTTRQTNPLPTEDDGTVSFWIEPGTYDLLANGVGTTVVIAPIPAPPGPDDYITRAEMDAAIAAAGGGLLPAVTAKGDLYAASAANVVGILPRGADGEVLSADSTATLGLKWVAGGTGGGVTSVFGRTGVVTAQSGDYTKAQVGLGNVDNTSDANKPISTATQAALDLKESIAAHNTDVGTLTTAISGKAATVHTHAAGDVTSGTFGVARGGTGLATVGAGNFLSGNGTAALNERTPAQVLSDIGAAASSHTHAAGDIASGTLGVARGGTGLASVTAGNFLTGNGTGAMNSRTPAQVLSDIGAQAADADLTTIAGLTATTGNVIQSVAGAWASQTPAQLKSTLSLVKGDVGLGNVDNTSDATKFASPTLTGTVTMSGRLVITPDALSVVTGAVATDASLGNHFDVAATANFTLSNPTNPSHGQRIMWAIKQDGTGSRVMTLDTAFALGTDITSVVLTTTANKTDLLGAVYDSTAAKWRVCMFVKGFA